MSIKWKSTNKEAELVDQIVVRAKKLGLSNDVVAASMDITAVHLNGCRLRLEDFLNSDDLNFIHDFAGIQRHIDRETGKLLNHFRPRFAAPAKTKEAS